MNDECNYNINDAKSVLLSEKGEDYDEKLAKEE